MADADGDHRSLDDRSVDQQVLDDTNEQREVRLAKRARLLERGRQAYPVGVPVTDTVAAVRERYADLEADVSSGEIVGLAGRIVHLRNTGKLCFAALQAGRRQPHPGDGEPRRGGGGVARRLEVASSTWATSCSCAGEVITSRRGELSMLVHEWRIAVEGAAAPAEPAHRAVGGDAGPQPLPRPHRAARDARRMVLDARCRRRLPPRDLRRARLRRAGDADAADAARAAPPPARSSRSRTRSTPSCTCGSRPSCS